MAGNQIFGGHKGPLTHPGRRHVPGNRLYNSGRCVFEGVFQVVFQVTEEPAGTSFHHVKEASPIAGLHVWGRGTCQGETEKELMAQTTQKTSPALILERMQTTFGSLGQGFLEVWARDSCSQLTDSGLQQCRWASGTKASPSPTPRSRTFQSSTTRTGSTSHMSQLTTCNVASPNIKYTPNFKGSEGGGSKRSQYYMLK